MSEWQPIETAPKDGNAFVVWMEDEGWWATVRWVTSFEGEDDPGWLFDDDIWCAELDTMHNVTGWMRPQAPNT